MGLIKKLTGTFIVSSIAATFLYSTTHIHTMGINCWDWSKVRSQKWHKASISQQVKQKKGKKYALLFNAGGDKIFESEIKFAYKSLRRAGFSDADIFVLNGDGKSNPVTDFVDYPASRNNLEEVISKLKKKVTPEDIFLSLVTNHGGKKGFVLGLKFPFGESGFATNDGTSIYQSEFKKMMEGITPNYGVLIFSQCFSGGFAEELGYDNFIGISSSSSRKVSYSNREGGIGGYFDIPFFSAIGGLDPNGNKVNADKNNDGKVSIEETFDYAVENDEITVPGGVRGRKETPQLFWQNANPNNLYT